MDKWIYLEKLLTKYVRWKAELEMSVLVLRWFGPPLLIYPYCYWLLSLISRINDQCWTSRFNHKLISQAILVYISYLTTISPWTKTVDLKNRCCTPNGLNISMADPAATLLLRRRLISRRQLTGRIGVQQLPILMSWAPHQGVTTDGLDGGYRMVVIAIWPWLYDGYMI